MDQIDPEIEFINPPPYDHKCPVCFELLKNAYQTTCCGNHICFDCSKKLKGGKCHKCRENFQANEDKFFSRQLLNLEVRCYYHKEGCTWKGELRGLEQHVATNCNKGIVKCEHCSCQCKNKAAMKQHLPICGEIHINCPNNCLSYQYKRKCIQNHLEKECPLRVIVDSKGCIPRAANNIIQIAPLSFTMTNYLHHLESGDPWYSPPFYTHRQGYTIHLKVLANRHNTGYVAVVVCIAKGEYDHLCQWPLCAEIEVGLFNWRNNGTFYTKTLYLSGDYFCTQLSTEKVAKLGNGDFEFIAHHELQFNPDKQSEYLQHNCLNFQVKKITFFPATPVPDLPLWAKQNCLCQFTITSFSQTRKKTKDTFSGPPFYTHDGGYKLYAYANLNGFSTGKGSHVSLSVVLMKGEYDDMLSWPLSGDIVVEMLNWREDKNHVKGTISFSKGIQSTSSTRVLTGDVAPTGWGLAQFASHSTLSYNHSTNTEFVRNDCLLVKVKSIEIYSPQRIPVLSWRRHNDQVLCEFTLTDFNKRKEFNSYYYSESFFTHCNGYKMQLKVNFNNDGYIGVYAYLMKSSNDDNLLWPFCGDVVVELLNWKEDIGHHKEIIELSPNITNTTRNRVTTGERGNEAWGYSQFISHSALGYNSSKNTQYLQDDCLQFRVKEVIVHSTDLSQMLPRWQNPRSVSPNLEFTVTNFSKRKEYSTTCIGPAFVTHNQGYKLQLEVQPSRKNEDSKHVSVYARLLKGENDQHLMWPFQADIVIELLNWRQNVNHLRHIISFNERTLDKYTGQVISGEKAIGSWGTHQLISYSNLSYNSTTNTEYLQNDCLRFKLKEIIVYSTPNCKKVPNWQNCQPTKYFEFTITRFSQHIRLESAYFTPPFYTSSRGHKMCLKVYPAGESADNKGTHMSAYGFLLKGEYDDSLSWPFYADVVIDILNWRGDHSHHRKVLQFDDDSCADARARVYDDDALAPNGWGNNKVIPHSTLFPRYTSSTEYLQDDCMRIRIYDVVLYNTPLLNKTPQWQNWWNTSTTWPIEVTVTGFHKHKMYNTEHISPPFYTHKYGYKMRLEVNPNGSGDGKGTHLSIFARLLKGENDYDLKWPMNIDLTLELVNWRENDSHILQVVNFAHAPDNVRAQVTGSKGKADSSWGKIKFCTHHTLFSKSRNIEYIQDDCIRVRVKGAIIHSRKGWF